MSQTVVFGLFKSFHDLFTALWVGGILTTAISFMPAYKKVGAQSKQFNPLLEKYQNRLRVVAVISIVGLWITGLFLGRRSPEFAGFMDFSTPYALLISIKHLIILAMIFVAVFRGFILGRKIQSFTSSQMKSYMALLIVNSILGIIVLFLSGISAALV